MTRRLILAALALFAFLSLESCGVSRIAGPTTSHEDKPAVLGKNQPAPEDAPAIPSGDQTPVEGERAH